jgi:hypothetical protein
VAKNKGRPVEFEGFNFDRKQLFPVEDPMGA